MNDLLLTDAGQTLAWGRQLAGLLQSGDILLLAGGLGAGKTSLTQAIAEGLGVPPEVAVTSPSFSLLHQYHGGRLVLTHMDLYRLAGPGDVESAGLLEYLVPEDEVVVVEWPDRLGNEQPKDVLALTLELSPDGHGRLLRWAAQGPSWQGRLGRLPLLASFS